MYADQRPEQKDITDWRMAAARRNHRTSHAPAIVIEAVEHAEIDWDQSGLDDLLK